MVYLIKFLNDQSVINNKGLTLQLMQDMLEDKQENIWFGTALFLGTPVIAKPSLS